MSDKYIYQRDGSIKKWIEKPRANNNYVARFEYPQLEYEKDLLRWKKEMDSLPSIPANLQGYKEGDVLVEGIDFEFGYEHWEGSAWLPSSSVSSKKIALPLKKEQSNAGDENVWIDVKDGLPDMGEVVWVKHTHGNKPALAWINYQNVWQAVTSTGGVEDFNDCFNYDFNENPITHYQLLNQP